MTVKQFLSNLKSHPESISFQETIQCIDSNYLIKPSAFSVGSNENEAGQNMGSLKILAFAKQHQLSEAITLHLFGDYYRHDVIGNPDGNDHQNIRNFMTSGWSGVVIPEGTLIEK